MFSHFFLCNFQDILVFFRTFKDQNFQILRNFRKLDCPFIAKNVTGLETLIRDCKPKFVFGFYFVNATFCANP